MSRSTASGAGLSRDGLALVAQAVVIVAALGWWIWLDWQAALREAGFEFQQVARTNTVPVLLATRDARRVAESIDGAIDTGREPSQALLRRELGERFKGSEVVDYLPADSAEAPLSTSVSAVAPAVWREQLLRVVDVAQPTLGWAYERGGAWMLPVFYRRADASHIVVSLPVDGLVADWVAPNLREQAPMGMRSFDDRILLRRPFTPKMLGSDASKSPSAQAIRDAQSRGQTVGSVVTPATETDSVVRLIAWAEVPGTGAKVLVAASRSDLFGRWFTQRAASHALALVLLLASFFVVGWSRARLKAAARTEKRARVAAEQGVELVRHALDASRDTTWRMDLASGELRFDTDLQALLGMPVDAADPAGAEERHGLRWLLSRVDEAARTVLEGAVRQACAERVGIYQEFRVDLTDGSARHLILKGGLAPDAARPLAVGTLRDVTRLVDSQIAAARTLQTLERMCRLARIGPWTADVRTGVIEMSPWAREIYEVPPGTDTGLWLAFPGADPSAMPQLMQARQRLLNDGVGYDLILPVPAADGSQRWVRSTAVAVRDASGRVERVDGALQEVTETVLARQQLDSSERRMRELALVVSSSSQLLLVTDAQERITWCNASFERASGYSLDEIRGRRPGALLQRGVTPPDVRDRIHHSIDARLPVRGVRLQNFTKAGQTYWVDLEVVPVFSDSGELQSFIGLQTDVTADIAREQELARSKLRYELATRNAMIGIWELDYEARQSRWNDVMFELTGWPGRTEVPRGALLHERIHEADREAVVDNFRRVARDPSVDRFEFECRFERSPGDFRWMRNQCVFERDPHGNPKRAVGTLLDITVERDLSQERRARAEADARSAAKTAFLSNMSHELRTPLNAVIGYAQIIEGAQDDDAEVLRERVKRIESAGWHLLALIDDILDLARIEGGHAAIDNEAVALEEVVADALDLIAPQAAARGISVRSQTCPLWVTGDVRRLRQVMSNLLSNAVKYNVHGGSIRLKLERLDQAARIEVSDTGLGMTTAQQAGLFQPFNRLGREASGIEGTGIGLTITKTLVECMAGALAYSSVPGQGTSFVVTLPLTDAPGEASNTVVGASGPRPDARKLALDVLCIEDNDVNALVLEESVRLLQPGWRVRRSSSLEAASREVEACIPDLIVLDQNLPDGQGLVWLTQARGRDPLLRSKVVMLSADAMPETRQRALAHGIDAFLNKPFALAELAAVLDTVLLAPAWPERAAASA